MRLVHGFPLVLAGAIVTTAIGGVAVAVGGGTVSVKACATSSGTLALRGAKKTCPAGDSPVTLGERGPAGARGPRGLTGPRGQTGPAGSAQRINFSQLVPEASTVTHYLVTSGPVSLIASCQGSAAAPKMVLSVTGGTKALTFTATEVSSDTAAPATTTVVHGATTSLGSSVLDTETTAGSLSDLITTTIGAQDGTQVTGTIDVELNTAAGSPACTVNGTFASA